MENSQPTPTHEELEAHALALQKHFAALEEAACMVVETKANEIRDARAAWEHARLMYTTTNQLLHNIRKEMKIDDSA
jgi:hypothetical protein